MAKTPAKKPAAKAVCGPGNPRTGYESVSVRPIDNGFIVSRSTDRGYTEVYSATKPKLEIPKAVNKPKR
jgi:hypothetical protein